MSTRVMLAGAEVKKFFDCMVKMKCKSVLATYWSLQKDPTYLKRVKDKHPEIDFIIDSGAFTFFNKEKKSISYYKRYMEEYVKWLEKYKDYIFSAAELDIDPIIGDTAKKWREDIFEPLSKKVPIIFIWHGDYHTPEDWKKYCQRYAYVGLGTGKVDSYQTMISVARPYLAKIHAFGYTKSTEIQKYDFFSCDSSTWLLGSKYGESNIFNGKTISRYDNKKKAAIRQRYRTKFQAAGLDWNLIEKEDYYEVIKMNMLSFVEMEEFLSRANAMRAYWRHKLPKVSRIEKSTDDIIEKLLRDTQGWGEEDFKAAPDPADRKERCILFSQLQWGRREKVIDWMQKQNRLDCEAVFTQEVMAKVADHMNPTVDEMDAMRKAYNMSLLKTIAALKRTSAEDYSPSIIIRKRSLLEEEQLSDELGVIEGNGIEF